VAKDQRLLELGSAAYLAQMWGGAGLVELWCFAVRSGGRPALVPPSWRFRA